MPARTPKASQHLLTKPCQPGQTMYRPNSSLSKEHKNASQHFKHPKLARTHKYISTTVDLTPPKHLNMPWLNHPMLVRTESTSLQVFNQTSPMAARTQKSSRRVLTKLIQCQRGQNMNLYLCRPDPSIDSEITKCILTCVHQTYPKQARTKCNSTCVTKPMQCQLTHKKNVLTNLSTCWRVHNMHLNMCWLNRSNASQDTKYTTTCVEETHPLPTSIQNASQR